MLVSARVEAGFRSEVAAGSRPCPEFLRLEDRHGVRLLDLTALGPDTGHRSATRSLRHVGAALGELRTADVVFSDGEHLGIPLALAMRLTRRRRPHLVIGHALATRAKVPWFRIARVQREIDRIIVHSPNQVLELTSRLRLPASAVRVVPYAVDTDFWRPGDGREENLVVSAGREHRDYETLVAACPSETSLFISDSSAHSPHAARRQPAVWPPNVIHRSVSFPELRDLYARASVVVVPLVPTAFSFGVTAVMEAMAMGKAVVATRTDGLAGVVEHGRTGLLVDAHDADGLRTTIVQLLDNPEKRLRLGAAARAEATARFGLDMFVDEIAKNLGEIAAPTGTGLS